MGGLLERGLFRRGAYLKFYDRQRQNYTMSMEFEMLRSFNNNDSRSPFFRFQFETFERRTDSNFELQNQILILGQNA